MQYMTYKNYAFIRQQPPGSHCLFIQQRRNSLQPGWLRAVTFQFFILNIYMKVFQIIAQNKSIICTRYFGIKTTRDSETKLFRAGIFFFRKLTFYRFSSLLLE